MNFEDIYGKTMDWKDIAHEVAIFIERHRGVTSITLPPMLVSKGRLRCETARFAAAVEAAACG